jgi:paraquat-inducible protein B
LINSNTRFWSAKGINLELSSVGFEVNIASLEALISGGVTFGVLEDLPTLSDQPNEIYHLFPDEEKARQGMFSDSLEYVLLVEDTVRGLTEGAPVEFRGIRVGTVKKVPWHFTSDERRIRDNFAIPVLITIEPQRLGGKDKIDLENWKQRLQKALENGLRASLKSGNLLTGALFVDLSLQTETATNYKAETFDGKPVIPTTPTGFAQIETKVSNLLDKLNSLQVEPILQGLDSNMDETQALLGEVRKLTQNVRQLVDNPELQKVPANLNQTLLELRDAIKGLSPESATYQGLNQTLQSLDKLLRELQPVARTLREQPNALIFNPPAKKDPQPPAASP